MKRLSLVAFLFLSFAANAKLSKIYCEVTDGKQLLRLETELTPPYKGTATLLNKKNEIVPVGVWASDPGFNYTEYKPWKEMRLSITIEPDGKDLDVWFTLDGTEDAIVQTQVGFNINEKPFKTDLVTEIGNRKVDWYCGGE